MPVYEAYYKQIDPKGAGSIEAMTAAKFLKKSGLSDVVLSRVSFHIYIPIYLHTLIKLNKYILSICIAVAISKIA